MSDLWNNIKTNVKLIIAYIILPALHFLFVLGTGVLNEYTFPFLFLDLLIVCLPPTAIRFILKKDGIKYGLELCMYAFLSVVMIAAMYYVLFEYLITVYGMPLSLSELYFPSVFDVITIYCILSYKNIKNDNLSKIDDWALTLLFVVYAIMWIARNGLSEKAAGRLLAYLILLPFSFPYSKKDKSSQQQETQGIVKSQDTDSIEAIQKNNSKTDEQSQSTPVLDLKQDGEPQPETAPADYYDIADKLIYISLAHIGRKTKSRNQYLTPEIEAERVAVERPFLELLSYKFKSDEQRRILMKSFMFYKEACLFLIYQILMKKDTDLHNRIRNELKNILSDVDNKSRSEYFSAFSKNYSYIFSKTKNTNEILRVTFWSTLAVKYPDWITLEGIADILSNDYLFRIFKYSYDAVGAVYKEVQML